MKSQYKRMILFLGILLSILGYLFFSSPGEIVINDAGEIKNPTNKVRAALQGDKFWKDQINEIDLELKKHLLEIKSWEEVEQERNEIGHSIQKSFEKYYKRNPDKQPSYRQRQAESLRERADQLEWDEFMIVLSKEKIKRIEELGRILSSIEAKTD